MDECVIVPMSQATRALIMDTISNRSRQGDINVASGSRVAEEVSMDFRIALRSERHTDRVGATSVLKVRP
jgi:hypothetical protein